MDEKNRLNLKNKLYQKTLFKDVKYVANGGSIKAPIVIDLDPTTLCNLACPECISTSVLNTHYFTEKRLSELAYEFASLEVRAVILIGGGEPLLHSGTPKAIQILASNGIRVGLVTNGTLLDKYLDTIAEYVNWTRVSVDAGTPETYQMFRPSKSGKNTFHKVISNMEKTIKLAKGVVGYSFLIMTRRDLNGNIAETNIQEIYTACRIAKEIGCKYFEVKAMMDINHFIHRQNLDTIESIKEQLYLINQLKTDKFEVV
jgi:MoaA/NifB/PqqE/SkfB family radical SAM enzyme